MEAEAANVGEGGEVTASVVVKVAALAKTSGAGTPTDAAKAATAARSGAAIAAATAAYLALVLYTTGGGELTESYDDHLVHRGPGGSLLDGALAPVSLPTEVVSFI